MKNIIKKALVITLLSCGLANTTTPPAQNLVTTFNAAENAKFKVFDLGKLTTFRDQARIPAPAANGDGIAFKFITENGLPVNFLIRRTQVTKDTFAQFKAINDEQKRFKENRLNRLAEAGKGILTAYYRQLPNQSLEWTELYTDIDASRDYRFATTFGARVYPNGLLVLDVKGDNNNLIFGLGEKTASQLLVNKDTIAIGGGKTALAKDLVNLNIK